VISGGRGNDTSSGGRGNDLVFANLGADVSSGGPGDDELWALARSDVPLPGVDRLNGGSGRDVFRVRDGEADVVNCGTGNDVVSADRLDVLSADCERVVRAAPRPGDESPENATQFPSEDAGQG